MQGSDLGPLLVGLAELLPWLKQRFDEPSPNPARGRPGSGSAAMVDAELASLHLTGDDLARRRPTLQPRTCRPRVQ